MSAPATPVTLECPDCIDTAPAQTWIITASEAICPRCNAVVPVSDVTVANY